MGHDPRVDAYIAKAAPFAQPILAHLRAVVHRAAPSIEEDIKWSMPMFLHNGKIVANMAAFKAHASFGFWRREVVGDAAASEGMGQFGKVVSLADLPPEADLIALVQRAMALVDAGAKMPRPAKAPKAAATLPDDLAAALAAMPGAAALFEKFPPGARREYIDWVVEAKQTATRQRRVAQAAAWIADGKRRNWKHENC